mmetsp:Transcript_28759/g.25458  ORF Transcript_28759/g.25458 Transcript_28759/m.25458 type:complete len:105 (+) Transcript_28759:310-624(+)
MMDVEESSESGISSAEDVLSLGEIEREGSQKSYSSKNEKQNNQNEDFAPIKLHIFNDKSKDNRVEEDKRDAKSKKSSKNNSSILKYDTMEIIKNMYKSPRSPTK